MLDRVAPPFYRWFTGGRLNTCYNALDRHVIKGRADQTALIYDSAVTGTERSYTYAELLEQTSRRSPAPSTGSASNRATGSSSTCR